MKRYYVIERIHDMYPYWHPTPYRPEYTNKKEALKALKEVRENPCMHPVPSFRLVMYTMEVIS